MDHNLVNQIIYIDILIQSLKWVLNLKVTMIQWSGFILKPWSFFTFEQWVKTKQGYFNKDLIPILQEN